LRSTADGTISIYIVFWFNHFRNENAFSDKNLGP
jgi:hypothetical protein